MYIRRAGQDDLEILIKLRFAFFDHINESVDEQQTQTISCQLKEYFTIHLGREDFVALLAYENDEIAGTAFLIITDKPAHPAFITGKTGTIQNVLILPKYQRRGIAKQLLMQLLEEAKFHNISVLDLLSTPAGEPLYTKLGFSPSQYQYLRLSLTGYS